MRQWHNTTRQLQIAATAAATILRGVLGFCLQTRFGMWKSIWQRLNMAAAQLHNIFAHFCRQSCHYAMNRWKYIRGKCHQAAQLIANSVDLVCHSMKAKFFQFWVAACARNLSLLQLAVMDAQHMGNMAAKETMLHRFAAEVYAEKCAIKSIAGDITESLERLNCSRSAMAAQFPIAAKMVLDRAIAWRIIMYTIEGVHRKLQFESLRYRLECLQHNMWEEKHRVVKHTADILQRKVNRIKDLEAREKAVTLSMQRTKSVVSMKY